MKPGESFVGQPVRSLQTMLRTIARVQPGQKNVVPDGIYSHQTREAVAGFQCRQGLPATGCADFATWNAIASEYLRSRVETDPAQPLQITLGLGAVLTPGMHHEYVWLIQILLSTVSRACPEIPLPDLSGTLDGPTEKSLTAFQIFSGLPPTGTLDKTTWRNLALQYARITAQTDW